MYGSLTMAHSEVVNQWLQHGSLYSGPDYDILYFLVSD